MDIYKELNLDKVLEAVKETEKHFMENPNELDCLTPSHRWDVKQKFAVEILSRIIDIPGLPNPLEKIILNMLIDFSIRISVYFLNRFDIWNKI